jgi:FAD binding domain of DNA photolyase
MQIDWDESEEHYHAWEAGKTGHPWIDAIMRQLNEIGWMHHLVQFNVHSMNACLTCYKFSMPVIGGYCKVSPMICRPVIRSHAS